MQNYVCLYELIFNRVFDPVESQALLRLLEIPRQTRERL